MNRYVLENEVFSLTITKENRALHCRFLNKPGGVILADGDYIYRLKVEMPDGTYTYKDLLDSEIRKEQDSIVIVGTIGGFQVTQHFHLASDSSPLEETLALRNLHSVRRELVDIEFGFQRRITKEIGWYGKNMILDELQESRLTAIPFKHRATDPKEWDHSFTLDRFIEAGGAEHRRATESSHPWYFPAMHRASEGWAWEFDHTTVGIFKFNQENLQYSVLALETCSSHVSLRFGGAAMIDGEPAGSKRLEPGEEIPFGVTRYVLLEGGYMNAAYAFRALLDEKGCKYPTNFNPPVHWNELYGNPEWSIHSPGRPGARNSRQLAYSRKMMEIEASFAVQYQAESLYMDPGWDTHFGSFLWGEDWLGPRKSFISDMKNRYGLDVSLHCPLATWMTRDTTDRSSWPQESYRWDENGNVIENSICLGSRQYLETAAERLLAHLSDGVVFLMFDGNWYNGGCWNPYHGHPVPYTKEDHCAANMQLAERMKSAYPNVLIEMHDMVSGGSRQRYTPVYYKYGLPNSFDSNWGFELMWEPMEDLLEGRARALYFYNLACNVPLYLHVDLRDDNEHCLVLWWYASTCRHLGIGGIHRNPMVSEAQKRAMVTYRRLKPFYTVGEFYGTEDCPEEAHVHVWKEKNAVVVNLFNLSPHSKVVKGSISVGQLGIDPNVWYFTPRPHMEFSNGKLSWNRRLPGYGTDVLEAWPLSSLETK